MKDHSLEGDREVYRDLYGVRGSIPRRRVVTVKILDPEPGLKKLHEALGALARVKGIEIAFAAGSRPTTRPNSGRSPSAHDYFGLADYCAGNGLRPPPSTPCLTKR